jgi:multiple sugar transport system substrate-binding protein
MKKRLTFLFWFVLLLCVILESSVVLGKTTISLWAGYTETKPFFEKAAKDYQESHPNVEIKITTYELRDLEQKFAVTFPSNTVGDIIQTHVGNVSRYIEAGLIPPNPPDIDAALKKKGSYLSTLIDILTYKNDTFGLPMFVGTREVIFWNKTMFAEAGLPGAPTNWDEVISYAQKLAQYDKEGNLTRSGISLRLTGGGSGLTSKFALWLYPAGGTIIKKYPDGKWRDDYDNEAGRDTLKLHIDLLYKYHVDDHKIKHDTEAFALGLTAMFIRESSVIGYMKEYAPQVEYDTALLPSYKRVGTLDNAQNLYVTKACKNPEIAWDFIKFMLQPKYQQYLLETVGWLPARLDVDFSSVLEKNPQYRNFVKFPENYEFYYESSIPCYDEIATRLAQRLEDAYLDQTLLDNPEGIAKVIHEAAEETNNILKENNIYHED